MDLSIITVTWNSAGTIRDLLSSVEQNIGNFGFEHIVVDNGSIDDTAQIIESEFPAVKLIKNTANLGFAAANNQGFAIASGEFLLFLNPDMQVKKGTISTLLEEMKKDPKIGIMGCKLVDDSGRIIKNALPRRFPTVWDQSLLILKVPHLFPSVFKKYLYQDKNFSDCSLVDSVRGAFMLMRAEIPRILGFAFDPRYFIWLEDVDICREAYKLGYNVIYYPSVTCIDKMSRSFNQRSLIWKQIQFTRSIIQYFKKWHPWWQVLILRILRPVGVFFSVLYSLLKK